MGKKLGYKKDKQKFNFYLIDDHDYILTSLDFLFSEFGGNVLGYNTNVFKAMKEIEGLKDQIDIITLDISMPTIDGLTLLPEIRKICPQAKIIMISASGTKQNIDKAVEGGAIHFIAKPFIKNDVFAIVQRVCSEIITKNVKESVKRKKQKLIFIGIEEVLVKKISKIAIVISAVVLEKYASLEEFGDCYDFYDECDVILVVNHNLLHNEERMTLVKSFQKNNRIKIIVAEVANSYEALRYLEIGVSNVLTKPYQMENIKSIFEDVVLT